MKDLTSGPGAPDLEIMWAPVVLIDFGFTTPPPGTQGLTFVSSTGRLSFYHD